MTEGGEKQGVAALERALHIVNAFRTGSIEKSLTELSTATGLYKSTILRLCVSLERFGYLTRLENGKFTLGSVVFELGEIYRRSFPYSDRIKPILQDLALQTKESATFWIPADGMRVCLLRVDSPQQVRDTSINEGDRLPMDQGATSVILRSFAAGATRPAAMERDDTYAISVGGYISDLAGISCPVFGHGGQLAGAITIAGPSNRFTPEAFARFSERLKESCARATEILGGDPSFYAQGSQRRD